MQRANVGPPARGPSGSLTDVLLFRLLCGRDRNPTYLQVASCRIGYSVGAPLVLNLEIRRRYLEDVQVCTGTGWGIRSVVCLLHDNDNVVETGGRKGRGKRYKNAGIANAEARHSGPEYFSLWTRRSLLTISRACQQARDERAEKQHGQMWCSRPVHSKSFPLAIHLVSPIRQRFNFVLGSQRLCALPRSQTCVQNGSSDAPRNPTPRSSDPSEHFTERAPASACFVSNSGKGNSLLLYLKLRI